MQQKYMHKAVTGRVVAKKLLSRQRQLDYTISVASRVQDAWTQYGILIVIKLRGRTHLSKFKFLARFPIGLHMILELQKIIKICLNQMHKIISTKNPPGCSLTPLFESF